ncbi:MAG: DUF4926 domain-containing protein [Anaerolineae bacterium]|nr:DUF4926 domain-containing protein [Anaerolineae bacterium]
MPTLKNAHRAQQRLDLLDVIVVTQDFPDHGVYAGEEGTIVEVYTEPVEAYEVEFVQADGRTRALFALHRDQFEVVWQAEELHRAEHPSRLYHIFIEPTNGAYRAYAPAVSKVVVHGDTVEIARERLTAALHNYLARRLAAGAPPPVERACIETVVIHDWFTAPRTPPPDARASGAA